MLTIDDGGIITVDEFWDCDCPKNYIHRKSDRRTCSICGTNADDMPDSRLNEILMYYAFLTVEEKEQLVDYIMRKRQ